MLSHFLISLATTFGYVGIFLASLIGSATIFLPVPSFIIVFSAGALLNPIAVGIIAGLGSAIGELTGYGIGYGIHYSSTSTIKKEWKGLFEKSKHWFETHGGFLIIFLFAATPLPDDIIGIIAGMMHYDIKRYFIATLLGKIILLTAIANAGAYGSNFFDIFQLPGISF
ncbi:MAG: VTT domain-containing protein [Candidatus Aenigmarchaeota archaeon]|nr:VTT domain-containing protein [Candidatus Aenigmarchaeota archaeon]